MTAFQITMALGAGLITHGGKIDVATMFCVASRAVASSDFGRMMSGAVVALEAGSIGGFSRENTSLLNMARRTLFLENSMGLQQTPVEVDAGAAEKPPPGDPEKRKQRQSQPKQ